MAQAFAIIHGQRIVEAYSAGSKPSGKINPKAIETMKEIGYDLTTHQSKSLGDIPQIQYDYLVGMGCGDLPAPHISSSRQAGNCPFVPAKNRIEWNIPDPKHMGKDEFRKVRDLIEEKVKQLLSSI